MKFRISTKKLKTQNKNIDQIKKKFNQFLEINNKNEILR